MENQPPLESNLPEGSREETFFVYDQATGDIVHAHKAVVLPFGGDAPSDLAEQALEVAEQFTKRKRSSLKALKIREDELEHGANYRVNPRSGRLERVPPGRPERP
jgi:hypothetical protein